MRGVLVVVLAWPAVGWADVEFARDVRPILSGHCFKCHGPDEGERQGGLRLDLRDGATGETDSGLPAVVPGNAEESELVRRVFSEDESDVMPPPHAKNPLTDAEKAILREWVASGADYAPHWAFVAPRRPELPRVQDADWPRNAIDHFVLARLEAEGLRPSAEADRWTLVRRVYLDLIGLPPTPEEAEAFVKDPAPDAYERLVDRLLASPHYGERWGRRWLDLARYADTNGYEKDRPRSIWPYRDWVIEALNAGMPFDQFSIEQLAGDMLPEATVEQRIATGFHRNTMLNEEGGIDPLEFRFHAMTDRVATTGTVWLGLTVGCAQCHTHKFDPIPHKEYYAFFGMLNNADEPEMSVPVPEIAAQRAELEERIAELEAGLAERFPPEGEWRWTVALPVSVASAGGAEMEVLGDGSVRVSGGVPERDTYTVVIESDARDVAGLRLEAMADPALPSHGPGRTPHGNFVLTEISAKVAPLDAPDQAQAVKFVRAGADAAQDKFPAENAIDGDAATGWAIHVPGEWNVTRTATFELAEPVRIEGRVRWTIVLDQQYGTKHTLGRFRVGWGERVEDERPLAERRRAHLERRFAEWLERESQRVVEWTVLRPVEATSNLPKLEVLGDGSVLSSGDQTKRDVYEVAFTGELKGVRAIRLEALPDERLPKGGPGRIYYEGPHGDFFLSEVTLTADGAPVKVASASHSFASGGNTASAAIDGNPLTGWSVNGGQGRRHVAVFTLAEPVDVKESLGLRLLFERYYAAGLGRFRVSVVTESAEREVRSAEWEKLEASPLAAEVEELLLVPEGERTEEQRGRLLKAFLAVAPELEGERAEIRKLRERMPAFPTTLVMQERPADNPRSTYLHKRGEFLQPAAEVEPGTLSVLHPLSEGAPRNRLGLARWLVSAENPLVGRVTMNREWGALFGQGLVRTVADFGYQGEMPSHPELLDWLAVEFVERGWSVKEMHRLMVTSATYRQSSDVGQAFQPHAGASRAGGSSGEAGKPDLRDPENRLLGRGPRFRIEAELIRDSALRASGLLARKIGGPSVFPPQPASVTTEGAYGQLAWTVSEGADRYRRGLYTFSKRTAPYAMFLTFDGPSGEACLARREVSNTPLQALTVLNDDVFVEAAQELGRRRAAEATSADDRIRALFLRCLVRPPDADEVAMLREFYVAQKGRLERGELDAAAIAGAGDGDVVERAAWTLVARVVLNLDEMVVKD